MSTFKFSLKLLGTHTIMSIVQLTLMLPLFGIFQNSDFYQWLIGIIYIVIFWIVIYADVSSRGLEDLKRDNYKSVKGFIAGIIVSIPGLILYIGSLLYTPGSKQINWFETGLRIWLVPYIKIFTSFEENMPHPALIAIIMLPIITGLSYMDGVRKRKKILMSIEKSDASKTEKSKIGIENLKTKR